MKKNIIKAIVGILVVPIIAACGMAPVALAVESAPAATYNSITESADAVKADDQATSLFGTGGIFVKITNTALFLVGAISVVMLIYGGIRYTVSGGESGAVTNAKNTILYAIVGIVISIVAYAVVQFVINQLVTTTA